MRVGGLGVVDPGHAVGLGDVGDPVAVGTERAQPVAHRLLADAVGAGERGRGQGVGDEVRGGRGEVAERAELGRAGGPLLDEGPVDEQVLDDTEVAGRRHAEGEARRRGRPRPTSASRDHVLGGGVGEVVDAGALHALVDAGLVGGVASMPASGPPGSSSYQSRWSSAMLSTTADSADIEWV